MSHDLIYFHVAHCQHETASIGPVARLTSSPQQLCCCKGLSGAEGGAAGSALVTVCVKMGVLMTSAGTNHDHRVCMHIHGNSLSVRNILSEACLLQALDLELFRALGHPPHLVEGGERHQTSTRVPWYTGYATNNHFRDTS